MEEKQYWFKKGEKHSMSKLKEVDIYKIKELSESGLKLKHIAAMYNISVSYVSAIRSGHAWKHI